MTHRMDMTCRCKGVYTCVACKVKRGDYKDWMLVKCRVCEDTAVRDGLCGGHYNVIVIRRTA